MTNIAPEGCRCHAHTPGAGGNLVEFVCEHCGGDGKRCRRCFYAVPAFSSRRSNKFGADRSGRLARAADEQV